MWSDRAKVAEIARSYPKFGLPQIWDSYEQSRPLLPEFRRFQPQFSQHRPDSATFGRFGPIWAKVGLRAKQLHNPRFMSPIWSTPCGTFPATLGQLRRSPGSSGVAFRDEWRASDRLRVSDFSLPSLAPARSISPTCARRWPPSRQGLGTGASRPSPPPT